MAKKLFDGYGCEIVQRGGVFFIRYDSGESAGSSIRESEISWPEAQKAMKSEKDAYEVILTAQARERNS